VRELKAFEAAVNQISTSFGDVTIGRALAESVSQGLETGLAAISDFTADAEGRFRDAAGRLRNASGRFVSPDTGLGDLRQNLTQAQAEITAFVQQADAAMQGLGVSDGSRLAAAGRQAAQSFVAQLETGVQQLTAAGLIPSSLGGQLTAQFRQFGADANRALGDALSRNVSIKAPAEIERIAQDIKRATADFRAGVLPVNDYAAALAHARAEAVALRGAGFEPTGKSLTQFNQILGATAAAGPRLGTSVNHIRSGLAQLAVTAVDSSSAMGQVAQGLLLFAGGSGLVIGVAAGIAIAAKAFQEFTKEQELARKKTQELSDELKRLREANRNPIEVAGEQQTRSLTDLQTAAARLIEIERIQQRLRDVGELQGAAAFEKERQDILAREPDLYKNAAFAAANSGKVEGEAAVRAQDAVRDHIQTLASLISLKRADAAQVTEARSILLSYNAALRAGIRDERTRLDIAQQANTLQEALSGKQAGHVVAQTLKIPKPDTSVLDDFFAAQDERMRHTFDPALAAAKSAAAQIGELFSLSADAGLRERGVARLSALYRDLQQVIDRTTEDEQAHTDALRRQLEIVRLIGQAYVAQVGTLDAALAALDATIAQLRAVGTLPATAETAADQFDAAAQGVVQISHALGDVDDILQRVVIGATGLAKGFHDAAGAIKEDLANVGNAEVEVATTISTKGLGGLFSAFAAGASLLQSIAAPIFGQSADQQARNSLLQRNNEALEGLRLDLQGFRVTIGSTLNVGRAAAGLASDRDLRGALRTADVSGNTLQREIGAVNKALEGTGVTYAQIKKVADDMGISIEANGHIVVQAFDQVAEAAGISAAALAKFSNDLDTKRQVAETEALLRGEDPNDPRARLERDRELLSQMHVGGDIAHMFDNIDLSTPEGIKELQRRELELIQLIKEGKIDPKDFGDFGNADAFLRYLGEGAQAMADLNENVNAVNKAMANVPVGIKNLNAIRFHILDDASVAGAGPIGDPGRIGTTDDPRRKRNPFGGDQYNIDNVTINVDGSGDPDTVAKRVMVALRKKSLQQYGRSNRYGELN
jgi:hypothetical protein